MSRRRDPDPVLEQELRLRLHRLADHAPATVRSLEAAPIDAVAGTDHAPAHRRRGRRAAGIGATIAVVAAGFGLTNLAFQEGGETGANTPEDAVRALAAAVHEEDVIGVLDTLLPAEGVPLRQAVERTTGEAQRVGLLDDSVNLGGLAGLDLTVTELQLEVQHLEEGLAVVLVTAGAVGATFDPAAFSFGPWIDEAFGDELASGEVRGELSESSTELLVAVVEQGGRWYVSPLFTAAEYARRGSGRDFPGEPGVVPSGADDPAQAATLMYERLATFDVAGALSLVAPGEGDAVLRYAPLWLADVERGVADARATGWDLRVSGLTFDAQGSGSRRLMVPTAYLVEGTVPPEPSYEQPYDPSLATLVFAVDGRFAVIGAGEPIPATLDGLELVMDGYPDGDVNVTWADEEGRITPLRAPDPDALERPQAVRVELAGGCTSYEGAMFAGMREVADHPAWGGVEILDDGYRICGGSEPVNSPLGVLSLLRVGGIGGLVLPDLEVVEIDGRWFVSPIGTLVTAVPRALESIPDGANLVDTWLAPYVLNGLSRPMLEMYLVDEPATMIAGECLAIAVVEGDTVVGLVDDPGLADLRACADNLWYGSWGPGMDGEVTEATVAPLPADE